MSTCACASLIRRLARLANYCVFQLLEQRSQKARDEGGAAGHLSEGHECCVRKPSARAGRARARTGPAAGLPCVLREVDGRRRRRRRPGAACPAPLEPGEGGWGRRGRRDQIRRGLSAPLTPFAAWARGAPLRRTPTSPCACHGPSATAFRRPRAPARGALDSPTARDHDGLAAHDEVLGREQVSTA